MEAEFSHLPVMAREVVELLLPVPAGLIVDCTVGGGRPRRAAARRPARRARCSGSTVTPTPSPPPAPGSRASGDRAQVVHGGFEQLGELVAEHGEGEQVMGILMDLGVSSPQLDRAERGFSYRFDAPLDMRMDAKQDADRGRRRERLRRRRARRRDRALRRGALRPAHRARDRRGPPARTRRASSPTSCATRSPPPTRRRGPHPGAPHVPGDPHGGEPRAAEPRRRSRRVGARPRPARPRARARVPLARGPHREADVRAVGRRGRRSARRPPKLPGRAGAPRGRSSAR